MTVLQAMEFLAGLIKLSGVILGQISKVSKIIRNAQGAGRDLTEAEIKTITQIDDAARASLVAAIERARLK
jgi:hypothetical protein